MCIGGDASGARIGPESLGNGPTSVAAIYYGCKFYKTISIYLYVACMRFLSGLQTQMRGHRAGDDFRRKTALFL